MPRNLLQTARSLFTLCLLSLLIAACSKAPEDLVFRGSSMGTSWMVVLIQQPDQPQQIDAQAIQTLLDEVENAMSNWKPDSDVSKFNQMPEGCLLVSPHTETVARAAERITSQSLGYFDASVSPLIEIWGFGVSGEPPEEPAAELLQNAMQKVDYNAVSVSERQLCKRNDQVQLNYSAIAKGYAVDQIATLLTEKGYDSFLVEVGGELYAKGLKPNGNPWKIGVEKPSYGFSQELYSTLTLNGHAVATSGDYRNFYEIDSVRYSHIIGPKTGRPVAHNAASVTVVHESTMLADGWATALLSAGPEEGMRLAEEYKLSALMIVHQGDELQSLASSRWLEDEAD